jgi:hypothetical protein
VTETEKKIREKAPFMVQVEDTPPGEAGEVYFRDCDIDTTNCHSVLDCVKAIKAKGQAGVYRIIQVKRTLTVTTEKIEKISIA